MRIWATRLPTKVKFFSWLLVRGRLNTRAYLHHRNIRTLEDSWCVHCNGVSETDVHIFSGCRRAQEVWSRLGVSVQAGLVRRPGDIGAGIPLPDAVRVDAIVLILWHLWKARNAAIFDNANSNSTDVLCRVARDLDSWASRYKKLQTAAQAWRAWLSHCISSTSPPNPLMYNSLLVRQE